MIASFKGKYDFLSNFYPVRITYEDLVFPSVEHAFVASKTLDFSKRRYVTTIKEPAYVKRYGKTLKLRKDWHYIKEEIMFDLLRLKFRYPDLKEKLLSTEGDYLQEGNYWHDNFWGVCKCNNCRERTIGLNILGNLLMKVREESKNEIRNEHNN